MAVEFDVRIIGSVSDLPPHTEFSMTKTANLAGIKVVVTRPTKRAGALCKLIEQHQGKAICFASLEILDPEETTHIKTVLSRLETFDIAIFVSRNAVEKAAKLLDGPPAGNLVLVAVGHATAHAIKQQWQRPVICPSDGANSEALLRTKTLQSVNNSKIIIFRGQGGRELLGETLQKRGASVDYAEVYRRACPAHDLAALQSSGAELITATSNESLQNLFNMATNEQAQWLRTRQLIVISQRTAALAHKLGFQHPAKIAPSTNDQGLLDAMLDWHSQIQN